MNQLEIKQVAEAGGWPAELTRGWPIGWSREGKQERKEEKLSPDFCPASVKRSPPLT